MAEKEQKKEQPELKPALKVIPKGDKPKEEQPKQAEAVKVVPAVRRLVIETDGNGYTVPENNMGLLEVYTVLQMLSEDVVEKLPNRQASTN